MGLYKRKNSPYWWYSFKVKGHPRILGSTEVHLSDKKTANLIYQKARLEVIEGKTLGRPSRITVKDMLTEYLKFCVHEPGYTTKVYDCKTVIEFMGDIPLAEVTPKNIEKFRIWRLGQGIHKLTINRNLCTFRAAINKNKRELNLRENPVEGVKPYPTAEFKRNRTLTDDQMRSVLKALTPMVRMFCIFGMSTGMRKGEIRDLKWSSVDIERGVIYILRTKEKKPKIVPIHDDVRKILNALPRRSEYVFSDEKGQKLKRDGIVRTEFKRILCKLGIKDFRFHDLRHVFATDMIEDSGNIKALSESLGHSSVTTTEIYVNTRIEFLKKEVSKKRSRFYDEKSGISVTLDSVANRFSRN